jgi:hypothetical protein
LRFRFAHRLCRLLYATFAAAGLLCGTIDTE